MAKLKEDILMDVRPRDLLKKLSLQDQKVELDIQVPDNYYQTMLEQLLERDYLNYTSEKIFQPESARRAKKIHWLQITRLPIHPNENESYDLLSRWQGVLLLCIYAAFCAVQFAMYASAPETRPGSTPERALWGRKPF